MKWTTANVKSPQYIENHEIYVGTQTGTFKKLYPANEEKPFDQVNLVNECSQLDKDSKITALAFGNEDRSQILIGYTKKPVQLHCLRNHTVLRSIDVDPVPVVGLASYDDSLIVGFENGQIKQISMFEEEKNDDSNVLLCSAGDDITHLRQCPSQRNMIATGGKGRQNNLKIFDMATEGKKIFCSKNVPNDSLNLEVPIWDSDIAFVDNPHIVATCSRYGYVRVYDIRKQRRPVLHFAKEDPQMSFATIAAQGNYIYAGTTMGSMKAFDTRHFKNFVHTYKGFTGSVSDICLDSTGKFIASASLDRYVRVHHTDSCALLYQCYVKSKATRVLLRESFEIPKICSTNEKDAAVREEIGRHKKLSKQDMDSADREYDRMFDNMQTISDGDVDVNVNEEENDKDSEAQQQQHKTGVKRRESKGTTKSSNKKRKL